MIGVLERAQIVEITGGIYKRMTNEKISRVWPKAVPAQFVEP